MGIEAEISPAARAAYIGSGRHYGSPSVHQQGNKTLNAFAKHDVVKDFGFPEADADRLRQVMAEHETAGATRETERTGKKTTNMSFVTANKRAKLSRRRARAVLKSARRPFLERNEIDKVEIIDSVLARTSRSGSDTDALVHQLTLLHDTMVDETIAAEVAGRGGPAAVAEIALAIPNLRAAEAERATPHGTPAETEYLDLLDGMIIELVRAARAAARAAADALGQPAIAKAFELDILYGRSSGGGTKTDTDVTA